MNLRKFSKKQMIIICVFIFVIALSFIVFKKVSKADTYANQFAIKNVSLKKIDTGTSSFDANDGLNGSNTHINEYTPGNDSSAENRIVRSFDTLTYYFDINITGKNGALDYEERSVDIKVTLPNEVAKYVSFSSNTPAGDETYTYKIDKITSSEESQAEIKLYVLGAPNGMNINPKFEIQESTNTDSNYIVTLGNISGDTYYYEYDSESSNKYNTISNNSGFQNYLPTAVSSKKANMSLSLFPETSSGINTTYEGKNGRYLTYVFGLSIDGVESIKGLSMPNGNDIAFDVALTGSGNGTPIIVPNYVRPYTSDSIDNLESIKVSLPYSNSAMNPGTISYSNNKLTIKDYKIIYNSNKINADGTSTMDNKLYIGTYALTIFSPREEADSSNEINNTLTINSSTATDTNNEVISIPSVNAITKNNYYENSDYSLSGEFYNGSTKLSSKGNGYGSTSKGTTLTYKTTFDYNNSSSNNGLKEIIKVDPNAFRVVPIDDNNDVKITVISDKGTLNSSDFEIKFITGNYNKENYSINNSFDRIKGNERQIASQNCSSIDLNSLNNDQVQNLYGGPCLKANSNIEKEFNQIPRLSSTDDSEEEDPITKILVQTKDGVKLPDKAKVIIETNLRVKNVKDLTHTYQTTVVASTSDYDNELVYYTPRITNDINSITSKDNYKKTVYSGSNVSEISDNLWGDSLKIVNFSSFSNISVTNKNTDGSVKTNYDVVDDETLNYVVKTNIVDNNEKVGADDTWYINYLKVKVEIPNDKLEYIEDRKLGVPEISTDGTITTLIYTLPYTKPNQKIKDINFKANFKPNITGSGVPVTVKSTVEAININGEKDLSYFDTLSSSFTIYATGINNVILKQRVGDEGSVVEKDSVFSYILTGYNNTENNINDYTIVDVLPSNNDKNKSVINGKYKVKVELPNSLSSAIVTCSTDEPSKLINEVNNSTNVFKSCNITNDYVDASAIKITGIKVNKNEYIPDIKVYIKPENNSYSDKYINSFVGGSSKLSEVKSNKTEVRVVSRNISGHVFVDMDEDGIKEENDMHLKDIPVSLYKIDNDNLKKISDTTTDENGYYKFKDLDIGKYLIRANYDSAKYDLTLRYATEDYNNDSDAYKISEGEVEISKIRTLNGEGSLNDLYVSKNLETVENMDIGLINRTNFGFDMSKYITKIDLTSNNVLNTLNYDNETSVVLSVKNSLKATARVYYGITITNNSSKAGYAKLVQEDIPNGLIFDQSDPYNSDWFEINGSVQSVKYANDLIQPGESRYLKIVLDMPRQEQANTFVNTVTMLEIQAYEPIRLPDDKLAESNTYELGEAVSYAGVNWHVINVENNGDEQLVTLFADNNTISGTKEHLSSSSDAYKWSSSLINKYINNEWIKSNSLDPSVLKDQVICDDASGMPVASYGGTLQSEGTCQSQTYVTSKIRLLTQKEFETIYNSNLTDKSFLSGSYWLTNSSWINQEHNSYGQVTDSTNYKNKAKYVNNLNVNDSDSNKEYGVRPVITISNKNIIPE